MLRCQQRRAKTSQSLHWRLKVVLNSCMHLLCQSQYSQMDLHLRLFNLNQSLIRATEAHKAGLSAVVTERRDKKAAAKGVKAQLFVQLWEFPSNGKPMKQVQCKLQLKIYSILK